MVLQTQVGRIVSDVAELIPKLFRPPGEASGTAGTLLSLAAAAHEGLLSRAAEASKPFGGIAAKILARLHSPRLEAGRESLLCDPLLISGLHRLSRADAALSSWHRAVAEPTVADVACRDVPTDGRCLGHVLLALSLRDEPAWRGEINLETDAFGRIEFPGSDWVLQLARSRDGPQDVPNFRRVVVHAGRRRILWSLDGSAVQVFLDMSRDDCVRMLADNDADLEVRGMEFPDRNVRPTLVRKVGIPGTSVRYDPVSFKNFTDHAPIAGGIVSAVMASVRRCSSDIAREFGRLIRGIRAFELSTFSTGTIQSFSDPAFPGLMNINMPFSNRHEPRICPLSFCWFGHELGHNKSYLIETIVHRQGADFLRNPQQLTDCVPRYGRSLRVRTLLQIPYTHLYEWRLLADFWERGFLGLPWRVDTDPIAAGDDLAAEIEESFGLIDRYADVTGLGCILIDHLKNLQKDMNRRWGSLVSAKAGNAVT